MSKESNANESPTASRKTNTGIAKTVGAVALVLTVAGFLFTARQTAQEKDLREQYSRTAARAAEHVRLRLQGYQSQVRTLGAPLRDFPAARREHRVASEALSTEKASFEQKTEKARKTAVARHTYAQAQLERLKEEANRAIQRTQSDTDAEPNAAKEFAKAYEDYESAQTRLDATERQLEKLSRPSTTGSSTGDKSATDKSTDAANQSRLDELEARRINEKKQAAASYQRSLSKLMTWEQQVSKLDGSGGALAELSTKLDQARQMEAERSQALLDLRSGVIADKDAEQSLQQAMRAEREAFSSLSERYVLPSYASSMKACAEQEHLNDDDAFLCLWRQMARLARVQLAFEICPRNAFGMGETPRLLDSLVYIPVAGGVVCATVPLSALFESDFITSPDPGSDAAVGQVDQALLTDEQGRVLEAKIASGNLQLQELVLQDAVGGSGDEAPMASASRIARGALVGKVEVAGKTFSAFVQPAVKLTAPLKPSAAVKESPDEAAPPDNALGLNIAVLVDDQRLKRESLRFSKTTFMWVVLIVGLTLLSLPLAKLWLLGPGSRYGRFDAGLMIFAGLLAALLTIVTGWASYSHFNLSSELNKQLLAVGNKLEDNLNSEIDSAASALDKFRINSKATRQNLTRLSALAQGGVPIAKTGAIADVPEATSKLKARLSEDEVALPPPPSGNYGCNYVLWGSYEEGTQPVCEKTHFDEFKWTKSSNAGSWLRGPHQFGWTSTSGNQLAKFTSGPNATVPVNLNSREYFNRASHGSLQCLAAEAKDGCGQPEGNDTKKSGVAEIVRSMTTGKYVLIVASPADLNETSDTDASTGDDVSPSKTKSAPAQAEARDVLSVTTHLQSLTNLILPRDFSATVIDRSGRPLYHSHSAPGYSIFEDLNDPDQLRATMNAGVQRELDDTYLGASTRLSVHPFPKTDWFLIVMAPTVGVDAMTSLMASISVVGVAAFLILATLLVCLIMCIRLFLPRRRSRVAMLSREAIFRPQLSLQADYARAGFFAVLASIALCARALLAPRLSLIELGLLLLLSLVLVEAIIRRHRLLTALPLSMRRRLSVLADRVLTSEWALSLQHFRRRFRKGHQEPSWRFSLAASYCLWLLGLVALWVGVPATTLYAGAHEHVVTNAARADQAYLLKRLDERGMRGCLTTAGTKLEPPWLVTPSKMEPTENRNPTGNARWEQDCAQAGVLPPNTDVTVKSSVPENENPEPPTTHRAGASHLSRLLDLLGPLPAPSREDGLRHHSSSWSRDNKSVLLSLSSGEEYALPIPALLPLEHLSTSALLLLLSYLVAAFFALGFGQLAVRRLFFVGILAQQERLGAVDIDSLSQPLYRGSTLRLKATCVPTRLIDAKRHDFRFHTLHPGDKVPESCKKPLLIPELSDFTQSIDGQETLRAALGGGDPILVLTTCSLNDIQWLESTIQGDLQLNVLHLHELDQEGGKAPILGAPRYLLQTPSDEDRASYKACGQFRTLETGQSLPLGPPDKGLLITDLEGFLNDEQGRDYFQRGLQSSYPIIAFINCSSGVEKLISNKDTRALLLDFEKVRSRTEHDYRLSRHGTPSKAYMAELWERTTVDERRVLAQLVHHGFVTPHPKWAKVVERLAARAVLDPDNLTMHPDFQAFIRSRTNFNDAHPPEMRGKSTWDLLKAPLATAVAAVYAAFGVSEPGMAFGGLLAPSVLAALPAVMRIVSGMGGHGSAGAD